MVDRNRFEDELRRALNHFYDPAFLRISPLVDWLHMHDGEPVEGLRTVLRRAIEAFLPSADVPEHARQRRVYNVLHNRYIRQMTQEAEAARLGITVRHLRREQAAALELLADHLDLQFDLFRDGGHQSGVTHELHPGQGSAELNREMLWLADSQRHETCRMEPVLKETLELARPLATEQQVALQADYEGSGVDVAIPGTVLRQIVLNLLTAAVQNMAQGGSVQIVARECHSRVTLSVTAVAHERQTWRNMDRMGAALLVSRQLSELFGGRLILCEMDAMLVVQVVVPCSQRQLVVMAIEDNAETLRLWSRFVRGTRFSLMSERDATNALVRAMELRPQVIVLDVMMPDIDGWALLWQLRDEPVTSRTPIVVCTVLPQRDLALALGASDFIQKPTTGEEFRAALERQIAAATPR